jgi:hypothetical protein
MARLACDGSPMRTQTQTPFGDSPAADEQFVLRLLSEQAAIPLDQLSRFLGGPLCRTVSLLQRLEDSGCIEHRRFLVRDHPWFWPSRPGARL